jgi:hypothetical protein
MGGLHLSPWRNYRAGTGAEFIAAQAIGSIAQKKIGSCRLKTWMQRRVVRARCARNLHLERPQ